MNGNWPAGYGLDISTSKLYIFLWITSILLFSLVSCPCNHLIITEIHELCNNSRVNFFGNLCVRLTNFFDHVM